MTVNDAATDYALKAQKDSTYQTGIKDENGMQSSYMPDAFISAIKAMKEGDVEVVESTKYMIVLHRLPIKDDEDTLLESSDNRSQLLLELKNTEYADAVNAAAQSFEGVGMEPEGTEPLQALHVCGYHEERHVFRRF